MRPKTNCKPVEEKKNRQTKSANLNDSQGDLCFYGCLLLVMGFIFATLETRELEPKCVPGLFPGSLQGTHQPITQTFLGVRDAFLPHFTRDEPLRTSAWEARNSPVSFGQLLAIFFFMSLGQPQKSLRKLTWSVSFKFLKLENIFSPTFWSHISWLDIFCSNWIICC